MNRGSSFENTAFEKETPLLSLGDSPDDNHRHDLRELRMKCLWGGGQICFKGEDAQSSSGVSINFKTWVFYKGWFPRFGFFISRPYAVFYKMKVVFIKKRTFYSFQLFLKPKQWFCQMRYCINQNTGIFWNKYLKCRHVLHFGFWPLGRVGFQPYQTWVFYKIGWVFYKFAENWSI